MAGEAPILADPHNTGKATRPHSADYAEQSQFERSVKFEVSSVKQERPSIEPSDFTLHTSHFPSRQAASQTGDRAKQSQLRQGRNER